MTWNKPISFPSYFLSDTQTDGTNILRSSYDTNNDVYGMQIFAGKEEEEIQIRETNG